MQDRKALQAGTSHFLGQNFAKASEIIFLDKDGERRHAWTTSWGMTTRMIGALIMQHGDDDGLIVPPKLAPKHIVIIPVSKNDEERAKILATCERLKKEWQAIPYAQGFVRVDIDKRDLGGGEKGWDHIKKGVPIRVEVGPREMAQAQVFVGRRDHGHRDKKVIAEATFKEQITGILDEIQNTIFERAVQHLKSNIKRIDSLEEFEAFFTAPGKNKNSQDDDQGIFGGFAYCHWNLAAMGHSLLKKLKVSPRCIPLPNDRLGIGFKEPGSCLFTGKPSEQRVIFARSY